MQYLEIILCFQSGITDCMWWLGEGCLAGVGQSCHGGQCGAGFPLGDLGSRVALSREGTYGAGSRVTGKAYCE